MISVAIDGPAGAGKSTISRRAASELGFTYVDTGALYRAIGQACTNKGIDVSNSEDVVKILSETDIKLTFTGGEQRVILNGKDVSAEIRTEKASMTASVVSAIPEVRQFLLDLQRSFAKNENVIMDGRDIGTVVLPNAEIKIFLTASPESRADRRTKQLAAKGIAADYNDVLSDIIKRDHNDSSRDTAPLRPADDSIIVDTTNLTLKQSVKRITDIIKAKL